ncbi:hypothetical protein G7054_g5466 [Neopestalotiopsis clavispora]|nr:hypothetical protein G7054_g5466 [Neopestalotiopsis clavispora]
MPLGALQSEQALIQRELPSTPVGQSGLDCLTLNITVPPWKKSDDLPVLLFVHGGGFKTGSGAHPQYDMASITQLSISRQQPMISVSINYRVGAPGFLYSSKMKMAGYKPNNGLDDQRLALAWLRDNIAGFGGDPHRITFLGESAGARRARPVGVADATFEAFIRSFGASCDTADEQLDILRNARDDEIITQTRCNIPTFPLVDGDIIPQITTYGSLHAHATSNSDKSTKKVLDFCNDITFALPVDAFARVWSGRVVPRSDAFVYHFNCPNPWEGKWKDHATHVLDIIFVLQNYNDHLSPGQRQCAVRFAEDIITFVQGGSPWPAYQCSGMAGTMIYDAPTDGGDDESRFVGNEHSHLLKRRRALQDLVDTDLLDKLFLSWEMFMQGHNTSQ